MGMNFSKDDYRDTAEAKKLLKSNPSLTAVIRTKDDGGAYVVLTLNNSKFVLCTQKRNDRNVKIRPFKTYDAALDAIRNIGFKIAAVVF